MRFCVFQHRFLKAFGALSLVAAFVFAAVPSAHAVECVTDAPDLLYQNDGEVGLYLKRVGGPVLAGINESQIFEPASAIKVLIYTHGLRQIQDGLETLSSPIPWIRDLNEDVTGSHPCNVGNAQAEVDTLGLLLNQMMINSDNRHTDALRGYFGDANILATGALLGMVDTDFNHIIGCPDCDNLNDLTLVDLGSLYEAVAAGYLDEEHRTLFHDLMLNETNSGFINTVNSIVDQEVAKAGKPGQVATDFKALVRYASKGGSYTLFNCNADPADSLWRSVGGILELPVNNGNGTCEYFYGAWMNLIPQVVQSTGAVAGEMVRLAVCEALATWDMIDVASISSPYDPPNPWTQEGILIDTFEFTAGKDLHNVRFYADPLQCASAVCETNHPKKIHHDMVEFVPAEVAFLAAMDTLIVEVKRTIPMGRAACYYTGAIRALADVEDLCIPTVSEEIAVGFDVLPAVDVDIDDNHGNLSDNVMQLKGAKNTQVSGTFTVVNPNTWDQNVDFADGPGNIKLEAVAISVSNLVKIGDPAVIISKNDITVDALPDLSSGEAADLTLAVNIPDGLPVNAFYRGTVTVFYEDCVFNESASDQFEVELHLLPTQGNLNIVQSNIAENFCPDDPWIMEGQVFFSFDVKAVGDHRNIRVSSGGLRHDTLDKKLDLFNFYPEEIAFLAAGETRTINVITKIPIGQHSGNYTEYFRVVSENAGEDSVYAKISICELFDMDIRDDYANVSANTMTIQAISRANTSGGEWSLRAFDIGLPSGPIGNDDNYDGPGNTPIDCVECDFAEWSPMWHESDPSHNFYSNFLFTGSGMVIGDSCGWDSGEYKRMLVGLFVPPMKMGENHPGTYKGRLSCYAVAAGDTVARDHFDIEILLARIVGPPYEKPTEEAAFGGFPTILGSEIYWGDFRSVGLDGSVNLYRRDPISGAYVRLNQSPLPQGSSYRDENVVPGDMYSYRLGIDDGAEEVLVGPLAIGGNPRIFHLAQNAPNPVTDQTTISYDLAEPGAVSLKVFDINGRLVRVLKDATEPAGFYSLTWDRRNDAGRKQSSGIYFYRLDVPGHSATKKMVVLQ